MTPDLLEGTLYYVVFLFSTVAHEAAHAWSAWKMGDDTAQRGGQVTLDPTPHIRREPLGMVVVPILSWLLGGWLIGWASAPYDPVWARRHPRRAGLMALAGPAANLTLVLIAALLLHVGLEGGVFTFGGDSGTQPITALEEGSLAALGAQVLCIFFSLNLLLAVFNLLPMPPLDGSGALLLVLPLRWTDRYAETVRNPSLSIFALLVGPYIIGLIYPSILLAAWTLLFSRFF